MIGVGLKKKLSRKPVPKLPQVTPPPTPSQWFDCHLPCWGGVIVFPRRMPTTALRYKIQETLFKVGIQF